MSSFPESRGQAFCRSVANPAAGASFSIIYVSGWLQRIWGFAFNFNTDATVADRYVWYKIWDGVSLYQQHVTTIAQTSSVGGIHSVGTSVRGISLMIGWYFMHAWHPEFLMDGLNRVEVGALNMVAGDTFANIRVFGEEWIDD